MPIDNSSRFPKPLAADLLELSEGMAIVIDGDTAPKAITAGQYLFIKNHSTLATGGYHATAAIASGAAVTSSNVTADTDGIVNGAVSKLNGNLATKTLSGILSGVSNATIDSDHYYKTGNVMEIIARITFSGTYSENAYNHLATITNSAYFPRANIVSIQEDNSSFAEAWGSTCMMIFNNLGELKVYKSSKANLGTQFWVHLVYVTAG